jgi:hypothetical protein
MEWLPPSPCTSPVDIPTLQATLFEFAISELVRQHRASFQPLWSPESWAKLLIWLALNCGCSGDEAGLQTFAEALGPVLSGRLRRLFFQRDVEDLGLQVMADPAEQQVLVLPLVAGASVAVEPVRAALAQLDLLPLVAEPGRWQGLEGVMAVPWRSQP